MQKALVYGNKNLIRLLDYHQGKVLTKNNATTTLPTIIKTNRLTYLKKFKFTEIKYRLDDIHLEESK